MGDSEITQMTLVSAGSAPKSNQIIEKVAVFSAAGAPVTLVTTGDVPRHPLATTATAAGTAAKTTTATEPPIYSIVAIKFTSGNSAETPTMAFDGGSARAMKLGGTASAAAKLAVAANGIAMFFFDGTILHQIGAYT